MYSSWYFCKLVFFSSWNAKHRAKGRLQCKAWMNRVGQEISVESGQFNPPRSRWSNSTQPCSSSSSVFWGFSLRYPSNLRPFRLITLRFSTSLALLLHSPSASLSSMSVMCRRGIRQCIAKVPGSQVWVLSLSSSSFNSCRAWFCSHLYTTANQWL